MNRAEGCETCGILLGRLTSCMKLLDEAIARMRSLVGTKKPDEFAAVLRDTESHATYALEHGANPPGTD
jgi:hypothetical protein